MAPGAGERGEGPGRDAGSGGPAPAGRSPLRRALIFVHRWLTFLLGGILALVAGSGALLVYQHEIDHALNGDRYDPTPGDVGWREVRRVVERRYPEARLDLIWWPRWNAPVYEAYLEMSDGEFRTVVVDPGTGRIPTGEREPNRIMDRINSFHTTLLAGETGWWLVLLSTGAAVFLVATGLYLWWPGIRRFLRGFRVRVRRGLYPLNYDLHQAVGALTSPVLLLMALTGLALAFPGATTDLLHGITGEPRPDEVNWGDVKSGPPPDDFEPSDAPDYDEILERAHREVPGAKTFYITFPEGPRDPIHVRLQTGIDPKPFGIVSRLSFDRYTGELIQVVDPRRVETAAGHMEEWIDPLHMGRFGGHAGRGLYVLTCVVVVGLFGGGIYIWWAKRSRVRARRTPS